MRDVAKRWEAPLAAPRRRDRAGDILSEFEDESLALLLWQGVRQVWEWADGPRVSRGGGQRGMAAAAREQLVFAKAAAPEIAASLTVVARVSDGAAHQERMIAAACAEIAEWAEAQARYETALHYAEMAAAVEPQDPEHANRAGRVHRRAAIRDLADVWYSRAITLSRQSRQWGEYIRGHLGRAAISYDLGDYGDARSFTERAARCGRRYGYRKEAGEAYHDLMLLDAAAGRFAEAERYARRALSMYGIQHRRLPYLVADFAFLLLSLGEYALAVPILESFLGVVPQAPQQVLGTSTLAAAAGALGDVPRYEAACERVIALVAQYEEHAAPAWVNLGRGARALARWVAAHEHTTRGITAANARGDAEAARVGHQLLADIAARRPPEPSAAIRGTAGCTALSALADEMVAKLVRWELPAWRSEDRGGSGKWAV
jgi:tetratricopeptide (TPR) repeat protein